MGMLARARAGARVRAEARERPTDRAVLALRRWFDGEPTPPRSHHPPIPPASSTKQELLRLEKESLGLYVSEHPLSGVRDQLRRKTDATLAELERRRDGEVVTVGGIVSDLEAGDDEARRADGVPHARRSHRLGGGGRLQLDLPAARELCVTDRILVVKGRIDHKQQGETKLIALGGDGVRGGHRAPRGPLRARRARGSGRRDPRARASRPRLPRRVAGLPVARHLRGAEDATRSVPSYRVRPDPDFLAEAQALLGGASVLSRGRNR